MGPWTENAVPAAACTFVGHLIWVLIGSLSFIEDQLVHVPRREAASNVPATYFRSLRANLIPRPMRRMLAHQF